MRIVLDKKPGSPIYQQISEFFSQAILTGKLTADTRLPSMRSLAQDLGVSRITVENAYARLEAEGLVASRVGSGTYVLPVLPITVSPSSGDDSAWPVWQQGPLARSKRSLQDSLFRHLADGHGGTDPVYFSGGIGDPCLFPVREFGRVMQRVIRRDGMEGLSYGEPNGYLPLRRTISQVMTSLGICINPENILVTTGSQQALSLVVQALLRSDDMVIVEQPTYNGALDLFEALHIRPIGVPVDEQGMCVEQLEPLLQTYHPKLIYTIPNFQNPTGACLSSSRRRALLALALRYNVPILEDDYVGDLRYDGCTQPALKSLDPCGTVIYVSTFSKMLMPDLRVGFLAADGPIYETLVNLKCLNDLATSNLTQRALNSFLSVGSYQAHLRKTIRIYKKRREAMVAAVDRYLNGCVAYSVPQGGLFLWLRLIGQVDGGALIRQAVDAGVGFAPGAGFFIDKSAGEQFLRLNYAYQTEVSIDKGIRRLAEALARLN
ncbi:MAG: PLP-dependent aminotransferase family protein [Desulfofustis sp.]|jgi:GntR family transcriptional regulator/MocR family aminotransferase|nr:PLP-dependent aminotransferase family protein [Desulfofustis sp.]